MDSLLHLGLPHLSHDVLELLGTAGLLLSGTNGLVGGVTGQEGLEGGGTLLQGAKVGGGQVRGLEVGVHLGAGLGVSREMAPHQRDLMEVAHCCRTYK